MSGSTATRSNTSRRNWKRLRVIQSLTTARFHDAAFGLFNPQAFRNFLSGTSTSIVPRQVVNYNQAETDLLFDVTSKLTLRGGYSGTSTVSV